MPLPKPETCKGCPAEHAGKGYVPPSGPTTARVAVLGQGPGQQEYWTGEPFVGPSGEMLDRWLLAGSFTHDSVWVDNAVRCWLPGDRPPTAKEAAFCRVRHWLPAVRALPQLEGLVTVGMPATRQMLGNVTSDVVGTPVRKEIPDE